MIKRIINKLFRFEDIKRGTCDYLHRWTLFRGKSRFWKLFGLHDIRVYLHHFISSDPEHIHDHPNDFWSFMFKGWYWERYRLTGTDTIRKRKVTAPSLIFRPSEWTHRIVINDGDPGAWTIVVMKKKEQPWGFYVDGKMYPHKEYIEKFGVPAGCE